MLKELFIIKITLCLLLLTYTGCQKRDDNSNNKWGMRSVEYEHKIIFRDSAYVDEFEFTPTKNSKNYEIRMYFPALDLNSRTPFKNISLNILRVINGFEYSMFDAKTKLKILTNTVTYPLRTKNYSFNSNEPLLMWMNSKIELKKGNPYKIVMIVPPKRDIDEKYYDVVFVIGIAHSNYYL